MPDANGNKTPLELLTELPTEVRIPPLPGQSSVSIDKEMFTAKESADLVQIFNSEQWPTFNALLTKWEEQWNQGPEVYMIQKDQAAFDSGFRHCLKMIEFIKEESQRLLDVYANKNGEGTKEESK